MQNSTSADATANSKSTADVVKPVQTSSAATTESRVDSPPTQSLMVEASSAPAESASDASTTTTSDAVTSATAHDKQNKQADISTQPITGTTPDALTETSSPPTTTTTSASSSTAPTRAQRQAMAVQQTSSSLTLPNATSSTIREQSSHKSSASALASNSGTDSSTMASSAISSSPSTTDNSSQRSDPVPSETPTVDGHLASQAESSAAVATSTSLIKANNGFATGGQDADSSAANSSAGSAKVGNLSVYALAGIIAGALLIAAASYIAWDKWRKKKIAQEDLGPDPFSDKAAMPQPPSTGSTLRNPAFYPAPKRNRADNDGTSSFWNDSRSTRLPSETAPCLPPVPMHQAHGDGYVMDNWFRPTEAVRDVQPAAAIRSSIIQPPLAAVPARASDIGVARAAGRPPSQDLLQAHLDPRDSRRMTGGTGRTAATNVTSTSSQLDMVSTYAGYGDDPPTGHGSIFSAATPQTNRWTGVSASSVYSPDVQSAVNTPPPMPSKADWRISNYRKSYRPMAEDTISEEEAISFESAPRPSPPGPNFGNAPSHVPIAGSGLDFTGP